MTTRQKVLGLAGQAVSGAASAARHPVATAGYAFGLAKGATTLTIEVVRQLRDGAPALPQQREPTAAEEPPARPAVGERTRFGGLNTEAAPPRMPGGPGEAFAHEPHAESREVEHGEASAEPREVDYWMEEATPPEPELPEED